MVVDHPERFARVVMGNTGLPLNADLDQAIVDKVLAFRADGGRLSLPSMVRVISRLLGPGGDPEAYPSASRTGKSFAGTPRTCRLGF
ncbi:MAG: hypothetical protein CM15mP74_30090 [Halieaceae bacterium]|nr:MAG: hypothetical protein CM15mP74_30090 [Halieaceae bacterium]